VPTKIGAFCDYASGDRFGHLSGSKRRIKIRCLSHGHAQRASDSRETSPNGLGSAKYLATSRLPADHDTVRIVKGGTQSFSWAPVPDATRYRVQMTETGYEQLSWSNGYANAHTDTTITATSLDLPRDRLTRKQLSWSTAPRQRSKSTGGCAPNTTGARALRARHGR
jgi:hypothetical protein